MFKTGIKSEARVNEFKRYKIKPSSFLTDPRRKQDRSERRSKSSKPRLIEELLGYEEVRST